MTAKAIDYYLDLPYFYFENSIKERKNMVLV